MSECYAIRDNTMVESKQRADLYDASVVVPYVSYGYPDALSC